MAKVRNAWAIFIVATCLLVFSATAHSSEKVKGVVKAVYEDVSFCQTIGEVLGKKDVCPKDTDKKLKSVVIVSSNDASVMPQKDQKIIVKFKGAGKSTGQLLATVEDGFKKEDVEKIKGNGTVILWKMGEKGPVMVIEAKEVLSPSKDTDAKIILKRKTPRVEGC